METNREAEEELVFGDMTDAEIRKAMFWAAFGYLGKRGIGILPTWEDEVAFNKLMANLDGIVNMTKKGEDHGKNI